MIYKEYYVKSKDIPNKYDIYKEYSNGKKYKIGLAETTQAGDISIEKTLESSSGNKTQYFYIESPNGNRFVTTKILDKNGNLQYENSHKFKKINENHYVSTENGKSYDITYEENKITIKDDNGKISELPIVENGQNGISKDLIQAIKLLPGSVLADIQKYGLTKISIGESENAHYAPYKNEIIISKKYLSHEDLLFTILHELGHYKDKATDIRYDKTIRDTYEIECNTLLSKNSETEFKEMEYFIVNTDRKNPFKLPIEEMIAEVHALLYSNNASSKIESRSAFLQEHFPQTYKLIAEKLQDSTVEKTKNLPQGMNAQENANKKRLSSVETEIPDLTEALSTVAEVKIKRAWQHHDIETSTPDEKVDLFNLDLHADLNKPAEEISNEVTSLVLKNKLRDTLNTRFKIEDDKFNKILQSHKNEIDNLAKKYSNDNLAF